MQQGLTRHNSTIHIPFPSHRLANIALRAIAVDAELSPLVRRSFSLANPTENARNGSAHDATSLDKEQNTILVTHYSATTNRMLRVAVNGFFESVRVVIACMRELDVDVVEEEWIGEGIEDVDTLKRVQGLQETGTIG